MLRSLVPCLLALCACQRQPAPFDPASQRPSRPVFQAPLQETRIERPSDELQPGDAVAFGLVLPAGARLRLENDTTRMFYVRAPINKVMRYLQQRLVFQHADIHPLAAMIRGARLQDAGATSVLDVGVRDEVDRTLITVWNRTPAAEPATPPSAEDGLRAVGIDPRTGQPLPGSNN